MQLCLAICFQRQSESACLLEGDFRVRETCHTNCRVQQRAYAAIAGVFFQTIQVEMQRLSRC